MHKQCEDYFATNKDKIVKVRITARSIKCIYSLTSCIHLVDNSEICAKETAKYCHKWDDCMKSAAHSILQAMQFLCIVI